MKRVMGLDIGERRIGVAISDALGWTAQGIEVIDRMKTPEWQERIGYLIQEYQVGSIVVGWPLNMDGTLGSRAQMCQEVAKELEQTYHIPVSLWDERRSTVASQRTLIESNMRRSKRKQLIDQAAAAWILQGYLDRQRKDPNS